MRRLMVVTLGALMMVALTIGTVAAVGSTSKAPPFSSIGIKNVWLDPDVDYREPPYLSVLSVFVETGSLRPECLATLNEAWGKVFDTAQIANVYCAARNPTIHGVGLKGVWLHVFFTGEVGDDLNLVINVYQEGAKYFREPVYCGPSCD